MASTKSSLADHGDRRLKSGLIFIGGLVIVDIVIAIVSYAGT